MSQQALPIPPDVSVTGWTPLPVSSTIAANLSVTSTPDPVGVPFTVKLASLSWPQSGLHRLIVSLKRNGASVTSVTVRLLQGSQLIANAVTSPGTSFGNVVIDLTAAQKAYITDYTDLRVSVIAGPSSGTVTFTRSTTWVAEATSVTAQLWGQGGNGGDPSTSGFGGMGGGGGGGYAKKVVSGLTIGVSYTVHIDTDGTWFSTSATVLANAGTAGSGRFGGAGGAAGIGDTVHSGGNGGNGVAIPGGGGGGSGGLTGDGGNGGGDFGANSGGTAGSGGGAAGGDGGWNVSPDAAGRNGSFPGGGGGGAGDFGTTGVGGRGQVTLSW